MVQLYNGDCLQVMQELIKKGVRVDMILTDPPYAKTQNTWDSIIPFEDMWRCIRDVSTNNTPIILFGQGMFSSKLSMSNEKMYKYSLIWDKVHPSGFLNSNRMPLSVHEDILVFYKKTTSIQPSKIQRGQE